MVAGGALVTGRHPYEPMGPELQPILMQDQAPPRPSTASRVAATLGVIAERLFTVVLLLALFAAVGLITAAETSTKANTALTTFLHYNIKDHIDYLLGLLHIQLPK
jgi:hypothetical protein